MHMQERTKRMLAWMLALTLVVALVGLSACTGSSDEDEGDDTETSDTTSDETTEEDDTDEGDAASDPSDAELEDGAIAISKAYFGQFSAVGDSSMADFSVAVMVKDSEGNWWARVVATPEDSSMETEQIYVKLEPGNDVWFVIDMGTGIDPATDENYPEDVGEELQP
jgi:hypothetical protein